MPSLKILYDAEGWTFHHRAKVMQKFAPPDFDVSMALYLHDTDLDGALGDIAPDLLLLCRFSSIGRVHEAIQRRGWATKIVTLWNNGWPHRVDYLARVIELADLTVFCNHTAWNNSGRPAGSVMIPNGVDLEIFNVQTPIANRPTKVLWTGSELLRRLKGYDDYLFPLSKPLADQDIAYDFSLVDSLGDNKRTLEEMAAWYNSGTILVCASRTEGTPNIALEAAACGCALVSTPVGNLPELIRDGENGYLVDRSTHALMNGIRKAINDHPTVAVEMQKDIVDWSWADRCRDYYDAMRPLVRSVQQRPSGEVKSPKPNLSDDVTVFVTTVGAASFDDCLTFLNHQDCTFRLEIIDHVAPLSAAFQRMIDQCQTPYFVQVDEDMLLYPHAVRTLYEGMNAEATDVALYLGTLHDAHLGQHIHGVKIFRHSIVQDYPLRDMDGCETDQVARFVADGYRKVIRPTGREMDPFTQTLGLHGTHWTPELIFIRYLTCERRRRRQTARGEWIADLPLTLVERFRQQPNKVNFFAVLGSLIGSLTPIDEMSGEKDYRVYEDSPGLDAVKRLYDEIDGDGR